MHSRIRDIEDSFGACLRLIIAPHPKGVVVTLERLDLVDQPTVMLSLYGAEILTGFIMAARLTVPDQMPDEQADGTFPALFRLVYGRSPIVMIDQADSDSSLEIGSNLWDRLYAELCLVTAHGREIARQATGLLH